MIILFSKPRTKLMIIIPVYSFSRLYIGVCIAGFALVNRICFENITRASVMFETIYNVVLYVKVNIIEY